MYYFSALPFENNQWYFLRRERGKGREREREKQYGKNNGAERSTLGIEGEM